jgi:hypothetical protein
MPVTNTERRFLLVVFADFNAVINIPKIEFKEYSGLAQTIQRFVNKE